MCGAVSSLEDMVGQIFDQEEIGRAHALLVPLGHGVREDLVLSERRPIQRIMRWTIGRPSMRSVALLIGNRHEDGGTSIKGLPPDVVKSSSDGRYGSRGAQKYFR